MVVTVWRIVPHKNAPVAAFVMDEKNELFGYFLYGWIYTSHRGSDAFASGCD